MGLYPLKPPKRSGHNIESENMFTVFDLFLLCSCSILVSIILFFSYQLTPFPLLCVSSHIFFGFIFATYMEPDSNVTAIQDSIAPMDSGVVSVIATKFVSWLAMRQVLYLPIYFMDGI